MESMVQPHDDDPGWFTLADVLVSFVPGLGLIRAMRGKRHFLQQLRTTFSAFASAVVMIGFVAVFAAPEVTDSATPAAGVAMGVAAIGVGTLFVPGVVQVPLNGSSPSALLGSYRARFFVHLAYAEAAALLGFIGVFMTGQWWIYLLGAVFTFLGFLRLAPTEPNLRRDQEELNEAGCGLSLHGLLISTTA